MAKKADANQITFAKSQILASARFADNRDAVEAILDDGKEYTIAEVETLLHDFYFGKEGK